MRRLALATLLCCVLAGTWTARADDSGDLSQRDSLTGDWGGVRKTWEDAGVFLGFDEIFDSFANPSGGQKQGAAFEGRFETYATIDLGKTLDWQGGLFHINAYLIHGHGLSSDEVGNLLTINNIAATPGTRLFTLWLQQSLFGDTVNIRAGQLAADDEFFVSQYAALFVNSAFGWPSILGVNLPSGGPAYPLATPGIRVEAALLPGLTASIGLFNGDPAPPGTGDPQRRDGAGLALRTSGGALLISELAYAADVPLGGEDLPGTYKLGGWFHSGDFPDYRHDMAGLLLADPASSGIPGLKSQDDGFYVIADQLLWRMGATSDKGLGAFLRLGAAPGDRNLIAWHLDAGLSYAAPFAGRDGDTLGLGVSYDQVGAAERGFAGDLARFSNRATPLPDFESALELSYQMQLAPWWVLQPDLQFILHPGARLPSIARPGTDATVVGLRNAINL